MRKSKSIKYHFNLFYFKSEIRDQGFTRPKVLILLPFRNSAMHLVEILIKLSGTDQQVSEWELQFNFKK